MEIIQPSDPLTMERCRATGTAWVELAAEDREVYERVHNRLREIAEHATQLANRRGPFTYNLTSGFSPKSGVRGAQPKDLWLAIHRADVAIGMPQLYMIVSARGVEYGFAPAIHPSDFSSQNYKEKLRRAVPTIFASLPSSDSQIVREIGRKLVESGGWCYRRKTRQDPFQTNFKTFEELIGFLHTSEGQDWGAAAVCRYISPTQLGDLELDLAREFETVIDIFVDLLTATAAPATLDADTPGKLELFASDLHGAQSIQELIKQFTELFRSARLRPFGVDENLWSVVRSLSSSLSKLSPLSQRPQIKLQWSLGKGNWANIPWIAFLDQTETTTTQKGVYGALLFKADLSGCYLTLTQGVTEVIDAYPRAEARELLQEKADQYRRHLSHLARAGFQLDGRADLGTDREIAGDYEASIVAFKLYPADSIPADQSISTDLEALLSDYGNILKSKGAGRRSWMFQANPKYYDVDGALAGLEELSWLVNQYAQQIHKDDEVFIWKSGQQGGLVGTAIVLDDPAEFEPTEEDKAFNKEEAKFDGSRLRVRMRVDNVVDPPVPRSAVASHPSLGQLQILRMAQSTNSPVTPDEAAALWGLIRSHEQNEVPADEPVSQRVWLVSAGRNAERWEDFYRNGFIAIGWTRLGDLSRFISREQIAGELKMLGSETSSSNDAATCYDFAHSMREGDLVFVKKGRHSVVGYGVIVGPYQYDSTRLDFRNVRSVRWQGRGTWEVDRVLALKTITNISSQADLVDILKHKVGAVSENEHEIDTVTTLRTPFSVEDAAKGLFITKDELEELIRTWRTKKNIVLHGPPGVGKTYIAQRLAYALMGYEDETRVRRVQFHQSYSYEDFVQGYRPLERGFERKNGIFFEFVKAAIRDDANNYVFIIDEINRGNLSKIFGELMVLIEPDKREAKWAVPLTYAKTSAEQFYIPANVYLLGMMNTADRSLSLVDYALRRRFAFHALASQIEAPLYQAYLADSGVPNHVATAIVSRIGELNRFIADKEKSTLGAGFCIGHSFFTPNEGDDTWDEAWYRRVVGTELLPLLEEYWFENDDLVAEWRAKLLASF